GVGSMGDYQAQLAGGGQLAAAEEAAGLIAHLGGFAHGEGGVGAVGLHPERLAALDDAVEQPLGRAGVAAAVPVGVVAGGGVVHVVAVGHVGAAGQFAEGDGAGQRV